MFQKLKSDFVQLRNPRTGRYVKVDRARGLIASHKQSPGPYKNIPIVHAKKAAAVAEDGAGRMPDFSRDNRQYAASRAGVMTVRDALGEGYGVPAPKNLKSDFVQVQNPRTHRYIKVDRARGLIVGHKQSPGPYKNVPTVSRRSVSP